MVSIPYRSPKMNLKMFESNAGCVCVYHFYIKHSLADLTMLKHCFWALWNSTKDIHGPPNDPKTPPARLISKTHGNKLGLSWAKLSSSWDWALLQLLIANN